MDGGGNAAKAGLKAGDQVLYTSSFFGDELWPADKLGFTKTAIQAKPDSVYFVVNRFLFPFFHLLLIYTLTLISFFTTFCFVLLCFAPSKFLVNGMNYSIFCLIV